MSIRVGPIALALLLAAAPGLPLGRAAPAPRPAATSVERTAVVASFGTRPLVLEAGRQVGLLLAEDGSIAGRRTITLTARTEGTTTRRRTVDGDVLLLVASGPLAGYYVRESIVAHVAGIVGRQRHEPPAAVMLPAGTVAAYRFDAGWQMTSAVVRDVAVPHVRLADQSAVINGRSYHRLADGLWAGSWVPAMADGAAAELGCTTEPRAALGTRQVVRRTDGAGRRVALTFDMGGRLTPALRIMDYLLLQGVCTTIFPTGDSAGTSIGSQVLDMVRRYPQVFEVGNHTMHHCNLVAGGEGSLCPVSRPSDSRARAELTNAAAVIEPLAGHSPVPYWRPPYGAFDTRVLQAAASVSYTKTIMWDVDTIDWLPVKQGGPTAADIAAKVLGGVASGSVVLMHLGGFNTRAALPALVYGLQRQRNLTPTTISDLLARD
ncbi:MAG TPA: polysaccharide deacetylase family protein [Candidatus Limnocylindria bacterium]|nr:polysaccharide deacetylase family protein [Candidatus Limnocylindria bacterium]